MNNTPWRLFLEDQAYEEGLEEWRHCPPGNDWRIALSTAEAIQLVINHGVPYQLQLDHDLGEEDTSMNFLSWLFQMFPDAIDSITDWNVHSQNPNGADNINAFLRSWRKSRYLR